MPKSQSSAQALTNTNVLDSKPISHDIRVMFVVVEYYRAVKYSREALLDEKPAIVVLACLDKAGTAPFVWTSSFGAWHLDRLGDRAATIHMNC